MFRMRISFWPQPRRRISKTFLKFKRVVLMKLLLFLCFCREFGLPCFGGVVL